MPVLKYCVTFKCGLTLTDYMSQWAPERSGWWYTLLHGWVSFLLTSDPHTLIADAINTLHGKIDSVMELSRC